MATNHIQKLVQIFSWCISAYLPFDKHKLVLSLTIRDMAAHQICKMEQSQETRNELVDVIMLICHITTVANLDFIMMHISLQESVYIDPHLIYLVLLGFLRTGSIIQPSLISSPAHSPQICQNKP